MVAAGHELVRRSLVLLLGAAPDLEVVAVCADGQDAIDAVAAISPDVLVLDGALPGMDSAEVAAQILRGHPAVRIWLLTGRPHDARTARAVAAGVWGGLSKDGDGRTLLAAIRS